MSLHLGKIGSAARRVRLSGLGRAEYRGAAQVIDERHEVGSSDDLDVAGPRRRDGVPPQAVPTTLVLDAQGRVAARILGIADRSVLETLLEDTVAEAA